MNNGQPNGSEIKPKRKFLGIKWTKKKIIWTVIVLLVVSGIGYGIFKPKNPGANIVTDTVRKQDIKRTVLATGQVVSQTDLALSFRSGGIVQKINAKEGGKVKAGDVLATLDQKNQAAALTSARGSLAQAQANYQRVVSGASSEDVVVSQTALDNASQNLDSIRQQQDVLVGNAYNSLLNSTLAAVAGIGNTGSITASITGTYTGTDQGIYKVSIYATGSGLKYQYSGLETGEGIVDTISQPLGTKGLYIQFSDKNVPTNNSWTVSIPNTQAATYITNYNAYQAALQGRQVAVDAAQAQVSSAQAALNLKKSRGQARGYRCGPGANPFRPRAGPVRGSGLGRHDFARAGGRHCYFRRRKSRRTGHGHERSRYAPGHQRPARGS